MTSFIFSVNKHFPVKSGMGQPRDNFVRLQTNQRQGISTTITFLCFGLPESEANFYYYPFKVHVLVLDFRKGISGWQTIPNTLLQEMIFLPYASLLDKHKY
ncbi:hypothetical protein KIL84_003384 [Mauremys mutica]|uniref:Uncharacterized protein n=1 Tax=Mauremys mutica TaxID=74926 RepID=A0A9D3WU15_9SAUR|nr:hypothetical protein KIL84_003384 [Mauremys mutica]